MSACPKCGRERNKWRHCASCRGRLRSKGERQAERARRKARQGKSYQTIEQRMLKAKERMALRLSKTPRQPIQAPLLARYMAEHPEHTHLRADTLVYRARYAYQPEFRAKEIARRHKAKTKVWVSDGTLTPTEMCRLFAYATGCPYCAKPITSRQKTLDHIYPKSKTGVHGLDNALICCRSCNCIKHDADPEMWIHRAHSNVHSEACKSLQFAVPKWIKAKSLMAKELRVLYPNLTWEPSRVVSSLVPPLIEMA